MAASMGTAAHTPTGKWWAARLTEELLARLTPSDPDAFLTPRGTEGTFEDVAKHLQGTGESLGLFEPATPPTSKPREATPPPSDQFAPYAADPEPEDQRPAPFTDEENPNV